MNEKRAWVPHVGSYRRRMPVSLKRMYENALDWEHLPWLHSSSFQSIDCIEAGDWGWKARATLADTDPSLLASGTVWKQSLAKSLRHQPLKLLRFSGGLIKQSIAAKRGGASVLLELRLDRERRRWITTTLEGPGAGTEIWTQVIEHGPQDIEVVVDFFVPNIPQPMTAPIGHYYQALYQRLYDEDQGMMETRQTALNNVKQCHDRSQNQITLGPLPAVKAQLPLELELGGRQWRLIENQGELAIHSALCPHMLGPLNNVHITPQQTVRCPWHGYEFSLSDGSNRSGQRCKLPKPPQIQVHNQEVTLVI